MIADFRFSSHPGNDDVIVELFWELDDRMGQIVVPQDIDAAIYTLDLPDLSPLPIISAVAYGMVLAARSKRSLCLTGDKSVWPQEWGNLTNRFIPA